MRRKLTSLAVATMFILVMIVAPGQFGINNEALAVDTDKAGYTVNGFTTVDPENPPFPLGCQVENEYHPVVASFGNGMSRENARENVTLESSDPDDAGNTTWTLTFFPKYGVTRGGVMDNALFGDQRYYDLTHVRGGFTVSKDLEVVGDNINIATYPYGYNYYSGHPINFNNEEYPKPALSPENSNIAPVIDNYNLASANSAVPQSMQNTVEIINSVVDNADKTNDIFFKANGDTSPRAGYLPDPWRKNISGSWYDSIIPPGQYTNGPGLFSQNISISTSPNSLINDQVGGRYRRNIFDKAFSMITHGTTSNGVNAKYVLKFKTRPKIGVEPEEFSGVVAAIGSYQDARSIYAGAISGKENLKHDDDPAYNYDGSEDPALTSNTISYTERYRIRVIENFKMPEKESVSVPDRKVDISKVKILNDEATNAFGPVSVNFEATNVSNGSSNVHDIYFRDSASYCHALSQIRNSLRAEVEDIEGFKTAHYFRRNKDEDNTINLEIIRTSTRGRVWEPSLIQPPVCADFSDQLYSAQVGTDYGNSSNESLQRYPNRLYNNWAKVEEVDSETYEQNSKKYRSRWRVTLNGGPTRSDGGYSSRPWVGFGLSADMKIVGDIKVTMSDPSGNPSVERNITNPTVINDDHRVISTNSSNGKILSYSSTDYTDFQYHPTAYNSTTGISTGYGIILDQSGPVFQSRGKPFATYWIDSNTPDNSQASRRAEKTRTPSTSWAKTYYPSYDYTTFGRTELFSDYKNDKEDHRRVRGTYLRDLGGVWFGQINRGFNRQATDKIVFEFTTLRDPAHWTDGDVHRSFVMGHFKSYDSGIVIGKNHFLYRSIDYGKDDDGDGINNINECIIGTDPKKVDTDGDGRSDGFEVPPLNTALKTSNPYYNPKEKLDKTDPLVAPIDASSLKLKFQNGESIEGFTQPNRKVVISYSDTGTINSEGKSSGAEYKEICSVVSGSDGKFSCTLNKNFSSNSKLVRTEVYSQGEGYQNYKYPEVSEANIVPEPPDPKNNHLILTPIRITNHLIREEKSAVAENVKKSFSDNQVKSVTVNDDGSVEITFGNGTTASYPKEEVVYDDTEKYPFLNNIKDEKIDIGVHIGNFDINNATLADRKPSIPTSVLNRINASNRPQINLDTDHMRLEFYDPKDQSIKRQVDLIRDKDGNWLSETPEFYLENEDRPVIPDDPTDYSQLVGQPTKVYFKDSVKPLLDGLKVRVIAFDDSKTEGTPCENKDCTVSLGGSKFKQGPNKAFSRAIFDLGPLKTVTDKDTVKFRYPPLTLVVDDENISNYKEIIKKRICKANKDGEKYLLRDNISECEKYISITDKGKATITYPDGSETVLDPTQTVYQQLTSGNPEDIVVNAGKTVPVGNGTSQPSELGLPPNLRQPAQNWGLGYRIANETDMDTWEKDDTDGRDIEGNQTGSSDNLDIKKMWEKYAKLNNIQDASYDYKTALSKVEVNPTTGAVTLTAKEASEIDFAGKSEKTVYIPMLVESYPNFDPSVILPAGHTKPPYYQSHIYFVPVTVKNPLDAELVKTIGGIKVESQGDVLPLSVLEAGTKTYQVDYQFINKTSDGIDLYNFDDPSMHGKKITIKGKKYTLQPVGSSLKDGEKTLMQACFENNDIYKDGLGARSKEKRIVLVGGETGNGKFIPKELNCSLNVEINADTNQPWRVSDVVFRPIGTAEAISDYPVTNNTTLTDMAYQDMSNLLYSASYVNAYNANTDFPTDPDAKQPKSILLASAYDVMRLGGDFRLPDTGNTGLITWLAVLLLFGLVAGATSTWATRK